MKNLLIIIFLIALTCGCMRQVTIQKEIHCPKPEIFCIAEKWDGIPYDSSFEVNQMMDYYYVFEKVKQINTIDNEWSLSFINNRRAALMYDDAGKQKVMIARMVRYNKASMESGMGIPIGGHTGALSIKNNKIIVSVSPTEGMIGRADLYEGVLSGNYVSEMNSLGTKVHQNEFTWESHPALSPDGNVLFFSSDRIVGYGDTDLWYTLQLDDGTWSEPFNCGKMINTGCSELSPFINPDGKILLFSSAGHETVGGYDIFESTISEEFWKAIKNKDFSKLNNADAFFSKPKNLRLPLNTPADELFPSSSIGIDTLLYYSSNQDADKASLISMEGGFDIFVRKMIVNKKEVKKPDVIADGFSTDIEHDITLDEPVVEIIPTYTLTGTVFNAVTLEELYEADITVKKMPDNVAYKEVTTDKKGNYSVELEKDIEYEVTAQAKDLFFESASVYVDIFDNLTTLKQDFKIPEMLTLRLNFPTDVFDDPYRYTLDSNGVETSQTWQIQIEHLVVNIINSKDKLKKLVLIGHTDDVGTNSYNRNLGKKRVDFVVAELIKRGVPKELLEGRSAGESKPLIKRENEGLELYRKRLRRVELNKIWKN
ncbi:OmpA family protein [Bacteroidota bacterium]